MTKHPPELSMSDPFIRRFRAYLRERFPLAGHGLLIVSYYSSNQFLAKVLYHPGAPMHYSRRSIAGAVILFCMFFHLRVFDEHKDYADDCRYHPDRILQRGLITLRHLKIMGFLACTVEFTLAAILGAPVLIAVLITFGFSVLMLKEFFIPKWLKQHFLLYAVSHMLIMPLMALTIFSIATKEPPWHAPGWFLLYAFVGFFVTFNWEISRKIRAPEDEIEGLDSYSKLWGTYGAAYSVLIVRVIDTLMVAIVGWHLGVSALFYMVLIGLYLICLAGLLDFRFRTSRATAKRMEWYAGMYIIAFDLTLAVEIIRMYGFGGWM